jgi:hypothetical protein
MSGATKDDVTFVLCIENNAIRHQALLLCESIRRFAGPARDAQILAVAPRQGLGVDRQTQAQLTSLGVDYIEEPLNGTCPEYGSANRVFAAGWAESRVSSEWIVVLDSDTVVLAPLELPEQADVALRPVDSKGTTTTGAGDPFEGYWQALAALHGVPLDLLPFVTTTDREQRVRASYNGGLVVVRRRLGVLQIWADLFARSVQAGLKPLAGSNLDVHASTGHVGVQASEYWGSNQAALALAIWTATTRVHHYPESYNVPLHLLENRPDLLAAREPTAPVHVHYHWLFTARYHQAGMATLRALGAEPHQVEWLGARLPIRS